MKHWRYIVVGVVCLCLRSNIHLGSFIICLYSAKLGEVIMEMIITVSGSNPEKIQSLRVRIFDTLICQYRSI